MWPFRRHKQSSKDSRDDITDDIVSWVEERILKDPVKGIPPAADLLDSSTHVSDTADEPGDWRGSVQDPWKDGWGLTNTEVAKEPEGDRVQAEPSTEVAEDPHGDAAEAESGTTIVVITTRSPEASEGEAHIFAEAREAKRFVERLIDDGFDRECIKTIRGGQTQLRVSSRAVVDFD